MHPTRRATPPYGLSTHRRLFDVLLTRSHAANMIVVGSFGPDAPAGMLVGSTALTLIARAGCPVAVIRGARRRLPRPGTARSWREQTAPPPPTTPSIWRLISRHRWAPRWFPCTPGLEPGPAPQAAYTLRQEDEARAYLFRFGQCPRTGGNCLGAVMPSSGKRGDTRMHLYADGPPARVSIKPRSRPDGARRAAVMVGG